MSSPKLNLPMLSDYLLGEVMSSHDGVRCYPAIRRGTEEKYIVKVISVPASASKLDALLLTGAMASKEAALEYFMTLSQDVLNQTDILRSLSQQEGFVPYCDGQIGLMDNGSGYEVCLLGTYKHSLDRIMRTDLMTHADIANLGLDLCAALAACRRTGYLYADLKPGNIFRDPALGFCIGDVGFISLSSLKYASLPDKYRSSYTAPELADDMAVLNSTVDIYALGLVLYQAYNGGVLPYMDPLHAEILPPPVYADYEMADIILKACHPDPQQRWQEPTKMAQALISYLQTYGAPEISIIPPAPDISEQEEPTEEEPFLPEADPEQLQKEMEDLEDADPDELAFLSGLVNDETAPNEENAADVPDEFVTEELSEMFAQADELIFHDLPEPAIAPDPVFVPMPEPIALDEEAASEDPQPDNEEETPSEEPDQQPEDTLTIEEEITAQQMDAPAETLTETDTDEPNTILVEGKKLLRRVIAAAVVLLLLAGVWFFGQKYYNEEYLVTIEGLILNWEKDTVTVQVRSEADEQLLTVICTDSYGNSTTSGVTDGIATFTKLHPSTRYTIRVEVNGFHKLIGSTSESFSTSAETQIHSFTAGIGPEDCSVALNFTVSGPCSGNWTVHYSADGVAEKTLDFSGRSVVVTDLVPGALYTFTLTSSDVLYMAGQTQVQYMATHILYAKDLSIIQCGGGSLTAVWAQPDEGQVSQWQVRCFNESGYNVTITTSDLSHTFTGLDHSSACTVEVTAMGMNSGVSTSISAEPVTIEYFACTFTENMMLQIRWEYSGNAPEAGWLLRYHINDGEELVVALHDTFANLLTIPGATYSFTIETASGNHVFNNTFGYTVDEVSSFAKYGISAADMTFRPFLWLDGTNWNHTHIPSENFRNVFALGEQAGFVIDLALRPEASDDSTTVYFVLHNADGLAVKWESVTFAWNTLWNDRTCLLSIPTMPDDTGEYILSVFIDGEFVHQQLISVPERMSEDDMAPDDPAA